MLMFLICSLALENQIEGIRELAGEAEATAVMRVLVREEPYFERQGIACVCFTLVLVVVS